MSAQLASTNSFSAHLALAAGVAVSITADTMDKLAGVVAKLQDQPAANDTRPAITGKAATPAATTAPTPAPTKAPEGNAHASTTTQVSAQPAASGSEAAADAPRPTYDDVKAKVLALAKISRDTAMGALKKFGVDNANKLKLEDYPAFIAHADGLLKGGAGA